MPLTVQDLTLTEEQERKLLSVVQAELQLAIDEHEKREALLAERIQAYKAKPETEKKSFPWPGASNVVVPLVAITCDTIAARLQKSILGLSEYFEVNIKSIPYDLQEKDVRDWCTNFILTSGAADRLRTVFAVLPRDGDVFIKPTWVEETKKYHEYSDQAGNVVEKSIPRYTGVRWHVVPSADVVVPMGFDSFEQLPWFAERLRPTWAELKRDEAEGVYGDVDRLKQLSKERQDKRYQKQMELADTQGNAAQVYELYEIWGVFEIPPENENVAPTYEEVILTYSLDANIFIRKIYNPYFGKARHFVQVPFIRQPFEIFSMSAAEMCDQFQKEASTVHNQIIDAGTAANAGIIVTSPESNFGANEDIYPGKKIVTPKPKEDVVVVHLSEPSPSLMAMEQRAAFLAEKRSGVSSYNMGMESPVVGSQATATGTTALISEGNMRFWVSIDDMRAAIEELMYLTIQQEQQMRPEGYEWAPGRRIRFPQGDVRTAMGLQLKVTSESMNREMEVQNLQILMTVMNDYYARLMQASALVLNPQFPQPQKMMALNIMNGMQVIVKKFVERFNIENLDSVVPNILMMLSGIAGALSGQGQLAPPTGGGPTVVGGGTATGLGPGAPGAPVGSELGGSIPGAGGGPAPVQ